MKDFFVLFLISIIIVLTSVEGSGEIRENRKTVGFITGAGGLGDNSFTDITYQGLRKAQLKYGFQLIVEEPGKSGTIAAGNVEQLLGKCNVVILLGVQHAELAKTYAAKKPNITFIHIGNKLPHRSNLASIVFKNNEGSFLVGALAAWMTKSKHVGFIGGTDFDTIHDFRIGFVQGVRYASPDVSIREAYIASGKDASGFSSPKKGFTKAKSLYGQGVDIIYGVAGLSNQGIIHAAKMEGKYVIGVDTDQDHMARGRVLTSMLKRIDKAVYREISRFMEGIFLPGVKCYGLKEGGIDLSPMTYTKHLIPEPVLIRLEETRKKVISCEIDVEGYM